MGQSAKVTSFEALSGFAVALRNYREVALAALEAVQMNVRTAVDWVQHDRKQYWTHQVRRSEQQVHEAKINLQSCLTYRRVGEHRPSCVEEKKHLERCRRRLTFCEDRLEAAVHFARVVDRAAFDYQGGVAELSRWLEGDAHRAVAELDRLLRTLEDYVHVAAPSAPAVPVDALPPDRLPSAPREREPTEVPEPGARDKPQPGTDDATPDSHEEPRP